MSTQERPKTAHRLQTFFLKVTLLSPRSWIRWWRTRQARKRLPLQALRRLLLETMSLQERLDQREQEIQLLDERIQQLQQQVTEQAGLTTELLTEVLTSLQPAPEAEIARLIGPPPPRPMSPSSVS